MIYNNILDAMGNTPMVRLNNIVDGCCCADILVKNEALQVGGSVKTRISYAMIKAAEEKGLLNKETSIICEPTSGNQGIGLSLVGAVLGYKVRIVMPDSVSEERRKLCRAYGAEVVLVHDAGNIGECIKGCADLAARMASEDPNVYIPQQFKNEKNPYVHEFGTGAEIVEALGDIKPDGFVSGIGTGGTITGIGRALRKANPECVIWAVEPEAAALFTDGGSGTHMQMGIGDGIVPDILDQDIWNETCVITDQEAIEMSRRLAREEGLLCGITGGTNVAAALKLAKELGPGHTVVTLLPDTGERYFSTPLFED